MLYQNRLFLLLGLGESGLAMARWLLRQGARVRVADTRNAPPGLDVLKAESPLADCVCGPFCESLLDGVDELALSPGVSINEPLVVQARQRGIPVTGEIALFVEALDALGLRNHCRLIAITGTNGKTTTTTLVGHILRAAGVDAEVAGNISPAALDALMRRLDSGAFPEAWVLELSSFQLETMSCLRADAAAILNVTDDHLDRHGELAGYARAKAPVYDGAATAVWNRADAFGRALLPTGGHSVSFGLDAPTEASFGICWQGGEPWLAYGSTALLRVADVPLAGTHNHENALAALALVAGAGYLLDRLVGGLRSFKGLAHRVEWVARRSDGVEFFDDSKGTNVGATCAALRGLGRKVVLIAGGDGKGQDFSPLSTLFQLHARAVVLIGRDAELIKEQTCASGAAFARADSLPEAVACAAHLAQPGDAVLLSPACASFDMFRSYVHRAEVFVAAVKALPDLVA